MNLISQIVPKNNSDSQKLLDYLKTIIKPDGSVTWNTFNEISISEFINSFKNSQLIERYARLAIVDLNKINSNDLSEFSNIYSKIKEDEESKPRKETTWSFYIPFLADVNKSVKLPFSIKILGYNFSFTSKIIKRIKYKRSLPNHLLSQSVEIKKFITNSKSVFIKVNASGFNDQNAWSKVTLPYDVLRGVTEFTINFTSTRIFSSQTQRAVIHHPDWILAYSKDKPLDGLLFNTDNEKKVFQFKFTSKTAEILSKNASIFSKEIVNKSSVELLITALRQYSDALSSKYNYNQLLGLWQVAETLTLSKEFNGKTSEVASRLSWFTRKEKLIGSGINNTLFAIADKRNDIVHRGISDVYDKHVNFLKITVDLTLLWFFQNIKHLKTINRVSEFYRLRDKNNSDIKTIKEILKFVEGNLR